MAKNVTNHISYFLKVDQSHKAELGHLRHWTNLKIAFDASVIWLKGLTVHQMDSLTVKRLPNVQGFYERQGKLFPYTSQLPCGNEPSLLWSPIDRGLPVDIPSYNHHFFGIEKKISIKLVPDRAEKKASALMVAIAQLANYLQAAPQVRLAPLRWVLLEGDRAFLFGQPFLPIPGQAFWSNGSALLPVGFNFEFPVLAQMLNRKLNPKQTHWMVWTKDQKYFKIDHSKIQPLSISSFKLSNANGPKA